MNYLFLQKMELYSFTIEPIQIDAKTYIIQNIQNENENILKFEMDSSRKVFKNITKSIFLNEEFESYEKINLSKESIILDNLIVSPKCVFSGKLYSAYLFNIKARENTQNINEKLFINLDLKNKRSISLKDKKLFKNETTQLIIIVGN
ncbi:MAG: hypothetical protein U5K55_06380 [Aliarcobacter sp.]|nr:hypothetical protein [Aliarcobacter sp.]